MRYYPNSYPNTQPASSPALDSVPKILPGSTGGLQSYYPYAHRMGPSPPEMTSASLPLSTMTTGQTGDVTGFVPAPQNTIHPANPTEMPHNENLDSQDSVSNSDDSEMDETDVTGLEPNNNSNKPMVAMPGNDEGSAQPGVAAVEDNTVSNNPPNPCEQWATQRWWYSIQFIWL